MKITKKEMGCIDAYVVKLIEHRGDPGYIAEVRNAVSDTYMLGIPPEETLHGLGLPDQTYKQFKKEYFSQEESHNAKKKKENQTKI